MANAQLVLMRDEIERRVEAELAQIIPPGRKDDTLIITPEEIRRALEDNEVGDARLLVKLLRNQYCFDHAEQAWYRWQGHFWVPDRLNAVLSAVDDVVAVYEREAQNNKRLGGHDSNIQSPFARRIRDLQSLHRRLHVLQFAASGDNSLGITGEEWDKNPYLLACANGVIDLRTPYLRLGRPEDFIKMACPTTWVDLGQSAPTWEKFTREIFQRDWGIIQFVQSLFGYSIIGKVIDHIFVVLYGIGRNGKGTLLETVNRVLGPLAEPIPPEMLLEQRGKRSSASPSPDIMALRGRRIVWGSETDEGDSLDISKVKWLVGGDTLTGRSPYGKRLISFSPSHKLFLQTNHKPRVKTDDYAFWQRAFLLPFNLSFVDNPCRPNERRRDPELPEKLREESSGILAWLVRGFLKYRRVGLNPPQIVMAATEDYRMAEDLLGQFISDRCVCHDTARIRAGDIYEAYLEWAKENGLRPVSSQTFSKYLLSHGFTRDVAGRRHREYVGIELRRM